MDPTLTIALVFAIGMAARFYLRTLDMGRRNAALEADREFMSRRVKQQDATIAELLEKLDHTERLWKDAKRMYLDSLDEIAALRDGAAE